MPKTNLFDKPPGSTTAPVDLNKFDGKPDLDISNKPNELAGISERGTPTGAVGSGFLNSSFSGADISIIVNLPVNPIALENEIAKNEAMIDKTSQELNTALKNHQTAIDDSKSYAESFKTDMYKNTDASLYTITSLKDTLTLLFKRNASLRTLGLKKGKSSTTKTLATLQTISWSIFREKSPVRFLGSVYPRAYVRGPRTIAGSLIFTMFDKHALQEILDWGLSPYSTGHAQSDHDYYTDTTMLIDQLPPLDITLMFANEYGSTSYMNLYGVEFQSEGGTFSIEDLFSESTVQYVARDIDPIRNSLQRDTDADTNAFTDKYKPKTASQMRQDNMSTHNSAVTKRRNPYI